MSLRHVLFPPSMQQFFWPFVFMKTYYHIQFISSGLKCHEGPQRILYSCKIKGNIYLGFLLFSFILNCLCINVYSSTLVLHIHSFFLDLCISRGNHPYSRKMRLEIKGDIVVMTVLYVVLCHLQ